MRVIVDLKSHLTGSPEIIQVEKSVPLGVDGRVVVNGKYLIPAPAGVDFAVENDSTVLPIDGTDVASRGFAHLLAMFPQYGNIYFNPLLTSDHVGELDYDGTFVDRTVSPPVTFNARFQSGRETGDPLDTGQMPTHTAILPANTTMNPDRPGLLITTPIDISDYTHDCNDVPVGTDEFLVYWKLYGFTVTDDIAADYGAQAGTNEAALRYVEEVDQEPDGFSAYISTDGGANWCPVGLLEPVAVCEKSTEVLLAFRNDSNQKIYLAHYAILF